MTEAVVVPVMTSRCRGHRWDTACWVCLVQCGTALSLLLEKTFFLATWQRQRKAPQKISPTLFFFMASSPYLSGRAIYGLQLSHLSTKIFKQEMVGRVCLAPFLMNEPRGTSAPHLLSAERLPKNGPFSDLVFPFPLGLSRAYLSLPGTLSTTGMRCHEEKEHGRCFPGRTEAIWHEIFQILPGGLNISMPFHSSFLISSLLPLISPLISSTHLFFLKETTTSPPLQGFPLCGCFQWEVHRFWSLFWVQILIHHL